VTISLDTLRRERVRDDHPGQGSTTSGGLGGGQRAGLSPIRVNTVVIRGVNDDEIEDFVRFAGRKRWKSGSSNSCRRAASARSAGWGMAAGPVRQGDEIRERIARTFGPMIYQPGADGVAEAYRTSLGTGSGSSLPFRSVLPGMRRLRLSAERLKLCLFDKEDRYKALREKKATPEEIAALLQSAIGEKGKMGSGSLAALSSEMFKVGG
jgi:cyclic pyranopterin phosphate synthase